MARGYVVNGPVEHVLSCRGDVFDSVREFFICEYRAYTYRK